ncbi:MAG: hypothetical protein NVSMB31_07950 [Vulcanimicrobiaceae bacterium]
MNGRRFLFFIYSNKNIAGSLLGLGTLGLFFLGVIHNFWIEIVLGSYGIGFLAMPNNADIETDLSSEMDAQSIRASLDKLNHDVARLVPPPILALVSGISESILAILPQLSSANAGDANMYTIKQTALDYLPQTLKNYLALPAAYRSTYPVQDGKTATQLLTDQLTVLDGKMKEIVGNVLSNNTQALVANGNFLRDRFAHQNYFTAV